VAVVHGSGETARSIDKGGDLMERSWRLRATLPITAALALVAAACGSSGGGTASTAAPATQAPTTAAATTPATGAPATEAPTTTPATQAPSGGFQVPTTNCPADATQPLADGAPIKIGFIGPQTGPLAGFGIIAKGLTTYFNKINATDGGVAGHKLALVTKDDAYDPAKSKPAVEEAIQGDKIFASVIQVGTPNVAGTRSDYEAACVPQAWVGTGFPAWGDPANHPWTVGGIMSYPTEALIWSEFLKEKKPGAKVAELVYNNDFGKSYQKAFDAAAPANGFKVVASVTHEATSDLTNEVTQILAANPDVILGETTATFCTNLMKLARQGGFTGPIILSSTCQSVKQFVAPAGEAAAEAYTIVYTKDPGDATYADDPAIKAYLADVAQYGNGADGKIGSTATGYTIGYLITENLKRAAAMTGGLTRANLMNAIWSTDTATPLAIGGKAHVDGTTDAYAAEYGKIVVYDPASGGYKDTGFDVDLEGKTGIYKG
jgi:branched-chain amino acid transport system substrate-binding protein